MNADRVAALAERPVARLTRRDVARGFLSVPSEEALAALPELRKQLLAAGNPMPAVFWESAKTTLGKIASGVATIGNVHEWLESTGTEPTAIIGLHVWDAEGERSPLQAEMHRLLVAHLEDRLARGEIEPDLLASGDAAARQRYISLQEQWMTSPLPDGRLPMDALLDEQDEEFLAEWDEAEAEALSKLREVIEEVGERPLPAKQLREACVLIRSALGRPGWPGVLLAACGGVDPQNLPADDAELWLRLAAGIVSPAADLPNQDEAQDSDEKELDEDGQAIVALCSLQHIDWLAAVSTLAQGGPGTPAGDDDLAGYVNDYELDDDDDVPWDDDDADNIGADSDLGSFDLEEEPGRDYDFDLFEKQDAVEGLFIHVTALWRVLGAIDDDRRLTRLGWWGLPEALQRAWTPAG